MSKRCSKCREEKPLTDFYKERRATDGHAYECKACSVLRMKEIYARNPALKRQYSTRNKLMTNYGITPEQRVEMLEKAGYRCEICSREVVLPVPGCQSKNANIDHDHASGKVRGILCGHCNKGLGHFMDNPALLRQAATYLEV